MRRLVNYERFVSIIFFIICIYPVFAIEYFKVSNNVFRGVFIISFPFDFFYMIRMAESNLIICVLLQLVLFFVSTGAFIILLRIVKFTFNKIIELKNDVL